MDKIPALNQVLEGHHNIQRNLARKEAIQKVVDTKEAFVSANGCLATWTPPESTGRAPKDTLIVKHSEDAHHIDWDSPNNFPLDSETFDMLWQDALKVLGEKQTIYVSDRVVGADSAYTMPVRTITDTALTHLFTLNMFRPVPDNIEDSIFNGKTFTLLVLPDDKIDTSRYSGRLRKLPDGTTSNLAVVMDFHQRLGLVYGSAYGGSVKKLIFTVMNFYLPLHHILPLHCSANENKKGETSLFLGLSGTGKTTLSADAQRALLGDDEHGWNENGIANFEFGCYAKLIDLNPEKEPEIYHAAFHHADYREHGAIVENAMMYPNGIFDLYDDRLTPNSRVSYPLTFLHNIKPSSTGAPPKTILFLTADANGVLPPVSKLDTHQAMLWFLMGYTSKLAGTEAGVIEPVSTFSRFFGQPFMPCLPHYYSDLLGNKLQEHDSKVYLINTGWSGGPFGVGQRMDINLTRAMVNAALEGRLEDVECCCDTIFHLNVPLTCPGVPSEILNPENTWEDKDAYRARARKLAMEFSRHFDKAYGNKQIDEKVRLQCPGK
jgi:phosphoenolpyruvate carboxykinase (ATP)